MNLHDPSAFDAKAKDWDANPSHVERTRAIAQAIRRRVPLARTMRALEVGCGTGLLSFEFQAELGSITLTDTSAGMIDVLRRKIADQGVANMQPLLLDLATEELPAATFDLIYMQLALHHMPDVDGTLTRFARLLAPGGHLAIADLEREDGSFHGEGFTGHHGFDPAALERQVARSGFEAISTETVYQLRREGHERPFPVFLLIARKT